MNFHKIITIDKVTLNANGLHVRTSDGQGTIYGSKAELLEAVQQAIDIIADALPVLIVAHHLKGDPNLDSLQDLVGVSAGVDVRSSNTSKTIARVI